MNKATKELVELNMLKKQPSEEKIQITDNNSFNGEVQRELQIKEDIHAILTSFSFWYYVSFATIMHSCYVFILFNVKSISSRYYDEKFIVTYLGIATFFGFGARILSSNYLNYLGLRVTNIQHISLTAIAIGMFGFYTDNPVMYIASIFIIFWCLHANVNCFSIAPLWIYGSELAIRLQRHYGLIHFLANTIVVGMTDLVLPVYGMRICIYEFYQLFIILLTRITLF